MGIKNNKKILTILLENIVFFFYDIIFLAGLAVYLPFYFARKKITFSALKEKLGFIDINTPGPTGKKTIWIQAVSVGEINLAARLIDEFKKCGSYEIVISTTTLTGNRLAKKKYSDSAKIIFFPFDISFIIQNVIGAIKPGIFVALETEIWPNLFLRLSRREIPVVIINGRISDKAFNRYKHFKSLTGYAFKKCAAAAVQNEEYRKRFIYLGCPENKTTVTGNMKFESVAANPGTLARLKDKYAGMVAPPGSIALIAASTHPPEEEYILRAYKEIRQKYGNVKLTIAPRHVDRIPEIEKLTVSCGLRSFRLGAAGSMAAEDDTVFLLDTIGELLYLYSMCDICFVGGSLMNHGGQNILEPIALGKPTLFGPFMNNFGDIVEIVLAEEAGIQVKNREALTEKLVLLIGDKAEREKLQNNCGKVFYEQTDATKTNMGLILSCLRPD